MKSVFLNIDRYKKRNRLKFEFELKTRTYLNLESTLETKAFRKFSCDRICILTFETIVIEISVFRKRLILLFLCKWWKLTQTQLLVERIRDWTVIRSYVRKQIYLLQSKKVKSTLSSGSRHFRSKKPRYLSDRLLLIIEEQKNEKYTKTFVMKVLLFW